MLNHIRLHHKDQAGHRREGDTERGGSPPSPMAACRVQTIFAGSFRRYFGVLGDDNDDDGQERSVAARSLWAAVERKLHEEKERRAAATAQAANRLPDNWRLCDPFLLYIGWNLMLREEHSDDEYVRFAALPRGGEGGGLKKLPQMALDYIHLVSKEIKSGHVLLRKKIMMPNE